VKRALGIVLAWALVASAFSQSNFTIRRPLDGATVRETVPIRISIPSDVPRTSVYVGIWVNGKFLEAVAPGESGDLVYQLDTKGRKIADGKMSVEVVLYADLGETARILNRSSIEVNLDNVTSIKIPADGVQIRYKFQPGREFSYTVNRRQIIATITEAQRRAGSRAAELPLDSEPLRYLYAMENRYPVKGGYEGLVRMQPLPLKGKDYVFLRTNVNPEGRRYLDFELAPIYTRLTDTGREIFGSAPFYIPLEGSVGEGSRLDLFAYLPLPVLPSRAVRPGDRWAAPFLIPDIDLERLYEQNKFTRPAESRATLESIEYTDGRPTARIRVSFAQGAGQGANAALAQALGPQAVEFEELVWFDLGLGMPTRIERTITIDQRADGAGGGGAGGGAPTAGGGSGGGSGIINNDDRIGPNLPRDQRQAAGGQGLEQGGGGGGQGGGGTLSPGGRGGDRGAGGLGGAQGGRTGSTGGGAQTLYVRQRIQDIMILER